jgi:hypothetical protein
MREQKGHTTTLAARPVGEGRSREVLTTCARGWRRHSEADRATPARLRASAWTNWCEHPTEEVMTRSRSNTIDLIEPYPQFQAMAADMAGGENTSKLGWRTTRLGLEVGGVHS